MPFLLLVLAFVLVPIVEISILIRVGSAIGLGNTIAFVIFTAVLGAFLVRQQGFATIEKLRAETNAGRVPAMQMAEGVALLFAGAVLLTPGFLTDALGFALLIPPIRQNIIRFVSKSLMSGQVHYTYAASTQATHRHNPTRDRVIEGEHSSPKD